MKPRHAAALALVFSVACFLSSACTTTSDRTETGCSAGSTIGKDLRNVALNAITLGGAHAFEEGRRRDAETRAKLEETAQDFTKRGEPIPAEMYNAYCSAGGNPDIFRAMDREALSDQKAMAP